MSDRYIPIFAELAEVLERLDKKNDRLFAHRAEHVTKKFKQYCPAHKLHDLRHTFATRCLECGVNINVVQMWLGHSRLTTTADIYSHVTQNLAFSEALKVKIKN